MKRILKIGSIGSPVTLLSTEKIPATQITIQSGNSTEIFYAIEQFEVENNELNIVTFLGEHHFLNRKYIVKRTPLHIIKQLWDTTARTNYHKVICRKSTHLRYCRMDQIYSDYEILDRTGYDPPILSEYNDMY